MAKGCLFMRILDLLSEFTAACGLRTALALSILAFAANSAVAQTSTMFGNRGSASQSGGSMFGGTSNSNPRATSGSTSGFGTNAFGAQSGFIPFGQASSAGTMTSGFVGRMQGSQAGFVGAGQQGQNAGNRNRQQQGSQFRSLQQRGGGGAANRSFSQAGNGGFGNNLGGSDFGRGSSQASKPIQPRHEVAFQFPQRDAATIQSTVTTRINALAKKDPGAAGVTVEFPHSGIVVLKGQVQSEEARRLAEMVVRIEPGVRQVQNELVVNATQPAASSSAQ